MRFFVRFLLVVTVLLVAVSAVLTWWLLTQENIERWVLDPIERRTGVAITIDGVDIGLDGLGIRDVTIGEASSERPLLSAAEITARPEWDPLLQGQIVLSEIHVTGLHLDLVRNEDGGSNVQRILELFSREPTHEEPAGPTTDEGPVPATVRLERIAVDDARLTFLDGFERPGRPLRIGLELEHLVVTRLDGPNPTHVDLGGAITIGTDVQAEVAATGTLSIAPPAVVLERLTVSEIDVDTLVASLSQPGPGEESEALDLDGVRIETPLEIGRVRFEGFDFEQIRATAELDGTALAVHDVTAVLGRAPLRASAEIDFGVAGFAYDVRANLRHLEPARLGGPIPKIDWGRSAAARATVDARLRLAGTELPRLRETLDLKLDVHLDMLDLDALLTAGESDEDRELGPYDTGGSRVALDLQVDRIWAGPYEIHGLVSQARLADGKLALPKLDADVVGGRASARVDIDLTRPGLAYSGHIELQDADVQRLAAPLPEDQMGTRSGRLGFATDFRGSGTRSNTALAALEADADLSWTDGRVANSVILRRVSNLTGIPGFRNLEVMDSGGHLKLRRGVLSTDRIRVWGPEACIQAEGTVGPESAVDLTLALGIGPNSRRELFSTGIVLPYVQGEDGWRFVPVNVRGTLSDPKYSIPSRAVLKSALTAVPDVGVGVVSGSLGATGSLLRGGTDALASGTEAILPGASGRAAGSVLRGSGRLLGGGTQAAGNLVDGIGSWITGRSRSSGGTPDREEKR